MFIHVYKTYIYIYLFEFFISFFEKAKEILLWLFTKINLCLNSLWQKSVNCHFQGTVSSEEWEDRVQSDVTTSTYSTSSDSDLTENEIQAEFSEGSLSSKSINVNSGALPPESAERQGSSQHVINLLQPVCITRYHICFHGNRLSALHFEKLNLKLFKKRILLTNFSYFVHFGPNDHQL